MHLLNQTYKQILSLGRSEGIIQNCDGRQFFDNGCFRGKWDCEVVQELTKRLSLRGGSLRPTRQS